MTVKTGSAWAGTFVTLDATGALATPSTGPAGTLYVDGTANAATVTITGSNPYKWSVTLPSLTAGQRVDMYITATISSIATAGIVASAQADTVLVSDVKTETAAILEDTGNTLDGLIKDVPTVSEFEARTKPAADYALEATLTAIKGAGWTTESLKVIRDALTAVQADLDNPSQYKADVSALATTAHLQEVEDKVDTIDTIADAVKAKTDNLPAVPAQAGEYTAAIAALQADLDNPDQYKADVSGLAKTTDLNGLAKTTDLSGLATEANATSNKSAIITAIDNKPVTPVTDISTLATKTDVSGIPDALLSKVVVGTFTFQQILKIYAAIETGTVAGGGSASFTYTGKDGTTVTLSGVDENGNRTAVIVTPGA